jgi:hypothetical protein
LLHELRGSIHFSIGDVNGFDLHRILKAVPVTPLAGVVAALTPLLIPDDLIPRQVRNIRALIVIAIVVGILAAWLFQKTVAQRLKGIFILTAAAVVTFTIHVLGFVVEPGPMGNPPVADKFLVGYLVTSEGRERLERVDALQIPRDQQVRRAGPSAIPIIYGWSYWAALTVYAASFIVIAVGVVILLTSATVAGLRS